MSKNIGLYHPQLMNRVAICHLLNLKLSKRVRHVEHLFDLLSPDYSLVIIVEPELLSEKYNPELISSFMEYISKPVIIVPFYRREVKPTFENVTFMKQNPRTKELIDCIRRIETINNLV